MKKIYHTNFSVAVSWCNNALVLCNNLPEIDESIWDNMEPIIDIRNEDDDEDSEKDGCERICPECGAQMEQDGLNWVCPECEETEEFPEIFQWYITDCSKWDVEYLRKTFGLLFTYSNLLDCYILCVTHWGTGWDYVDWITTNHNAERECGQKK